MTVWVCSRCSKIGIADKTIQQVEYYNEEQNKMSTFICNKCIKTPGLFESVGVKEEAKTEQPIKEEVEVVEPEPTRPPLPSERKKGKVEKPTFKMPTPEELDNMPDEPFEDDDDGVLDI